LIYQRNRDNADFERYERNSSPKPKYADPDSPEKALNTAWYTLDFVPDRQSRCGEEDLLPVIRTWLTTKRPTKVLSGQQTNSKMANFDHLTPLHELAALGVFGDPSSDKEFRASYEVFGHTVHVSASPRKSCGYLYVAVWID
jgi:hypothetical protein